MYKIEKKPYGYQLTFGDFINKEEMAKWVSDAEKALASAPSSFGVLIDMRTLKPLPADAQDEMKKWQKLFKEKGMKKSAVILDGAVTKMQFMRIGKSTGIYEWERYIDASNVSNWEQVAIDWITKDIDPDK